VISIDDIKEMVIEKIGITLFLVIIVLCDLVVVLSILVCVWLINYISSAYGMNVYPINILQMLSEIGLMCIFIVFIIADIILTYKIHLKS